MEKPNILIVDTSASNLKISLSFKGLDFFIDERSDFNHIELLVDKIDSAFKALNAEKNELQFAGISCGPGSFTGIRIGIATVIGIAYSLNIKAFGFSVFDVYKHNLEIGKETVLIPVIDAKKNKFYCGFITDQTDYEMYDLSFDELYGKINSLDKKIIFAGKDFSLIKDKITQDYEYLYRNGYSSRDMLEFGKALIASGKELKYPDPIYLRKSEAEIALLEKYKSKLKNPT